MCLFLDYQNVCLPPRTPEAVKTRPVTGGKASAAITVLNNKTENKAGSPDTYLQANKFQRFRTQTSLKRPRGWPEGGLEQRPQLGSSNHLFT